VELAENLLALTAGDSLIGVHLSLIEIALTTAMSA
jgi:hypothetical protein